MVNGPWMKIQVGRRCPICGLMPNDLVRQEQQEALEQMLLSVSRTVLGVGLDPRGRGMLLGENDHKPLKPNMPRG